MNWNNPEYQPIPRDGTEILIVTENGIVTAWFNEEEPTNDAHDDGHYEWVCFNDEFTIDGDAEIMAWAYIPIPDICGYHERIK